MAGQQSRGRHADGQPPQPDAKAVPHDRFGNGLTVGLALATAMCAGAYELGLRYDRGGWLFIAPFLLAAVSALLFGMTTRPVPGAVASVILAAALIVPFWLGLDAASWLHDPSIQHGFRTWAMFALIGIPVAWLVGAASGRWWRSRGKQRTVG